MKMSILQNLQTRLQGTAKRRELQRLKNLYLVSLAVGFAVLLFGGGELLESMGLLNSSSLIEIRDSSINKNAFFWYLLWRRIVFLGVGAVLWWWSFAKLYLYIVTVGCGLVMGICLHICLMRYPLTGLFLWIALYFPHMIFYAAALFCGMILLSGILRGRQEKLKYLQEKKPLICILLGLYAMAVYSEAFWNVSLLQFFLEYF